MKNNAQREQESIAKGLRRLRELKQMSRIDLGARLNLGYKAIERIENARDFLTPERLNKILEALEISTSDFFKFRKRKLNLVKPRVKKVNLNNERRSYRKEITREVQALKSIRVAKNISQDQASTICGYSRATIGHIENGRIELTKERIRFILNCYKSTEQEFEYYLKSEEQRFKILDECISKLKKINDDKLKIVKTILDGF